ncbi:MAG: DUF2723 domain-containing protein [Elusimicrobiota bacterium]
MRGPQSSRPPAARSPEVDRAPRPAGLLLAALGLGLFWLYLCSAYPTLSPYRDSGDMAAGALTLGVAHPPGYPFYLLAAHAWLLLLRLGNVAFRLHVFSAAAGAAAAVVLAVCVRMACPPRLSSPPRGDDEVGGASVVSKGGAALAALSAGLFLGLSPAYWHLSLVSEMYSLNALVGAVLLWLLLPRAAPQDPPAQDAGRGARRRLLLAAMVFGLGIGNHQTLVAALPGLLWMARRDIADERGLAVRGFWIGRLLVLAAFSFLGLLLYAYLPLRSGAEPALDWGEPETLRNFFRMLTRADYGGVRLHPDRPAGLFGFSHWGAGLLTSGRLLVGELSWPGALLALWGAWTGRRSRAVQGCLLAGLLSGPVFIVWANLDPARPETYAILEPHLVLPLLFAAALAGWGAAELFRRLGSILPASPKAPLAMRRVRVLGRTLALSSATLLIAGGWLWSQAAGVGARLGCRRDFSAWDYGRALLASLPRGALVLDPDDQTAFTLSYLAHAHGLRRDVVPLLYFRTRWGYEQLKRRRPELLPAWEIRSGQELLGTLVARGLETGRKLYLDLPQKAPSGYAAYPAGLAYRLLPKAPEGEERDRLFAHAERMGRLTRIRPSPAGTGFFTRHTAAYWSSSLNNLGIQAQRLGRPREAISLYKRALRVMPWLPEAWNNWGNTALSLGELEDAEGCYRQSIRQKPAPQVLYNLGRVFLLGERYDAADRQFRLAIAAGAPVEARNDLGLVFLRTGRAREAVEQFMGVARDFPAYPLTYYNLGIAYERLGEGERARAAVEAYEQLARDPEDKRAARLWMKRLQKL